MDHQKPMHKCIRLRALIGAIFVLGMTLASWSLDAPHGHAAGAPASPFQLAGPGGTEGPLVALIGGAHQRVLVEAYTLTDSSVIGALQAAQRRGADVRVMLDPHGFGSSATLTQLQLAGIRTRLPDQQDYALTHLDAVVVDTSAVAILSTALTPGSLGSSGHSYLVIDHDPMDVLQTASIFYDDWLRRPIHLFGHSVVVTPDAANTVVATIDHATTRIELYSPDLSDPSVLASLAAARARGVVIRVLTPPTGNDQSLLYPLSPHGKVRLLDEGAGTVFVIDRRTVFIGSMDLSAGLHGSRDLGVLLSGTSVASPIDATFFAAFNHAATLVPRPKRQIQKVTSGSLKVTIEAPPLVRVGGQGVIVITTEPHVQVRITIKYPQGSHPAPGTTGVNQHTDKSGTFVYRWILSGKITSGQATAHIVVLKGKNVAIKDVSFSVTP